MYATAQEPRRQRPIETGRAADGSLTYLVDLPPEALPPVRGRDLAAAWDAARQAARAQAWGVARCFRFRRTDGSYTEIALADRDASCWAGAVDRTVGMHSSYGLSLCLRLLALIDLLARARWASGLLALRAGAAELPPALVRLAAIAPLTEEARFDEPVFRAHLATSFGRARPLTGVSA
ncbi:MAG: hypothetical protein JO264_09800 [Acidisphaera sp.]|nr:hypothetical protein [Acidisphaera sp.]